MYWQFQQSMPWAGTQKSDASLQGRPVLQPTPYLTHTCNTFWGFCIFRVPGGPSLPRGRTPSLPSPMLPSASDRDTECPPLTFKRSTSYTNAGPLASKPPTNRGLLISEKIQKMRLFEMCFLNTCCHVDARFTATWI